MPKKSKEVSDEKSEVSEPKISVKQVHSKSIVILEDGSSREYSQSSHGESWEVLAKAYAKNKKGTIIKS